jgi:hypothetical protein
MLLLSLERLSIKNLNLITQNKKSKEVQISRLYSLHSYLYVHSLDSLIVKQPQHAVVQLLVDFTIFLIFSISFEPSILRHSGI